MNSLSQRKPQLGSSSEITGTSQGIGRRDAMRWSAVAGLSLLGASSVQGAQGPTPSTGWIDAHVHVWTPDIQAYPLAPGFRPEEMKPASFTPEELMAHAAPSGVTRVVLIQMSYYQYDNRYMLDTIAQSPSVYRGVAIVDSDARPAATMKQLATEGVRGFRIQPNGLAPDRWLQTEGMRAMWTCGADEELAICHLINPEYLPSVATMCQQFPRTPVVIDHFARIGIDGQIRPRDLDNLCRLADYSQVSIKTSAFYALGAKAAPYQDLAPMIERLVKVFGAQRLMWASDCPFQVQDGHTYAPSLELVKSGLPFLSEDDREWILRRTAERIFFH